MFDAIPLAQRPCLTPGCDRPAERRHLRCGRCRYRRREAAQHKGQRRPCRNGRGTPCQPTAALPGSEEKIVVLMERVRLGQQLWHEDDARLPKPPALAEEDAADAVEAKQVQADDVGAQFWEREHYYGKHEARADVHRVLK